MHIPVLLHEVLAVLDPKPGEFFIDGTFGGGGHAREILKRIAPEGKLLGVDWDAETVRENRRVSDSGRCALVRGNFADLPLILRKRKLPKADGLLLDLGISSDQLEHRGYGLSFLKEEPLDMRYGEDARKRISAAEAVNAFSADKLADIFRKYGEERFAGRIAEAIVLERRKKPLRSTGDLVRIVRLAVPARYKFGRINPATKTFQALRIFVNQELENLEDVLKKLCDIVRPGGRAAVISFHSLEDRIVKKSFRELECAGKTATLTKKPVVPTRGEVASNPRSRSAKLRAARIV